MLRFSVAASRFTQPTFLAAGVLGATASCTLLVSLDGLVGSPQAVSDGGNVPVDVGRSTANDGSTVGDVSLTDAGNTREGAPQSFCSAIQPTSLFCEDFDHTPFGAGWVSQVDGVGTLSIDDASAVSQTSSRRVTIAAVPGGTPCRYVNDQHAVGGVYAPNLRVEHDLFLGHLVDTGGFPIGGAINGITVSAPDGTGACDFYFIIDPGGSRLTIESETNRTARSYPLSIALGPQKWTHIALDIKSSDASAPLVAVSVDSRVAVTDAPIPGTLLCKYGFLRTVTVGFFCYGGGSDAELHVDNLVARAK